MSQLMPAPQQYFSDLNTKELEIPYTWDADENLLQEVSTLARPAPEKDKAC